MHRLRAVTVTCHRVELVHEVGVCVGQEEAAGLGQAADRPVAQLGLGGGHLVTGGAGAGRGRGAGGRFPSGTAGQSRCA